MKVHFQADADLNQIILRALYATSLRLTSRLQQRRP